MAASDQPGKLRAQLQWHDALLIAAGAFLLLWPAIINQFPLIFHDTNSYIRTTPELSRSFFYKLFVYFTGFKKSIWTTIIAQSLITSAVLFHFLSLWSFFRRSYFVITVVTLALGSSLSVFVCFVMPDIFTGLMFVTIFSLVFLYDRMALLGKIFSFLLLLVTIFSHFSHPPMAAIITIAAAACLFLLQRYPLQGAWLALAASATAILTICAYNSVTYRQFTISPAAPTFLLANLLEYGPARKELAENCHEEHYRLCAFRSRIPASADQFLWDRESPFNSDLNGFAGMQYESSRIAWATIRHQTWAIAMMSARNSARALVAADPTADLGRMDRSVSILQTMLGRVYGPSAVRQFNASAQEHNRVAVEIIKILTAAGMALAIAIIALAGIVKSKPAERRVWYFLAYAVTAYVGNAILCATVSGVHDRYQARISWMIVLAALLFVFKWIDTNFAGFTGKTLDPQGRVRSLEFDGYGNWADHDRL